MKKMIIYFLCIIMAFQNCIGAYAAEIDLVGEQTVEEELLEFEESIEEEEEQPEAEESIEEEEQPEAEESIEENEEPSETAELALEEEEPEENVENEQYQEDEDPQFGREQGYLTERFLEAQVYSLEEDYIHNSRFDGYTIKEVIDVSKYQGNIDWNKVKETGIDYAFIRVGFRAYGESASLNLDDCFKININGAIAAGVKVGVYFFSQAITQEEAIEEAEKVLEWIDGYNVSLPVVIDFEYASSSDGLTGRLYKAGLSKEESTNICKEFCSTIEKAGYTAMVYANKDMLENGLNASEIAENYKIWLANYGTCTAYEGDYEFWQYTQCGTVDGISANVDKSFWYTKRNVEYAEIEEGIYTIASCLDENKVLDIPNSSVANGTNIIIYSDNSKWNQKYYIRPEADDTYVIMSVNSGKVLETNGNAIYQYDYTGKKEQQWRFIINENGSYTIESVLNNKVMDISGGKAKNGNKVIVYEAKNAEWQKFALNLISEQELSLLEEGTYVVETLLHEDKVIDLSENEENLEIQDITVDDKQKYGIEYVGNGCYQIYSAYNQKKLVACDNEMVLMEINDVCDLESKWLIKKSETGICTIISAKDGKNLNAKDREENNNYEIVKSECDGTKAQQFRFYAVELGNEILEDGVYAIHSALDDSKVLDVSRASKKSGANILLYSSSGNEWQQFVIKKMEDGTYTIHLKHSGMSMDISGSNVLQYFPVGSESQSWKIVPIGKGYYNIICNSNNKALDASGGKAVNGTNIIVYSLNGEKNQRFRFEKIGEIQDLNMEEKQLENGTYEISSSLNENQVLDVNGGSLYTGANIFLYASSGKSNQQFVFQKDSTTGLYTITSKKSGMSVVYQDGILKNGINVYQDNVTDKIGNQWMLRHIIDDYYMIYAEDSGFCMDVTGAKTSNGTNIEIYQSNNSKAQIFKLKKISDQITTEQNVDVELQEGLYTISTGLNNSMVLDVASASTAEGANILLYKNANGANQKFIVQKLQNGNYIIKALCSGKVLSVDGTNVCQKSDQGLSNQQWDLIYAGNGYYTLKEAQGSKVIDLTGGKAANRTNVGIYTHQYGAWQRFKFTQTTTTAEAEFVSDGNAGFAVSYEVYVKGNESSADDQYYLMLADGYTGEIYGSPLASTDKNYAVSLNVAISDRAKLKEIAMNKLVLAIKQSNGSYKAVTGAVYVSNPEGIAENTVEIFKASSKKGLQGVAYASNGNQPVDARYANTKQTLLNLDIADVVNPSSDYTTYTYKGKTYKFSNCTALVANIKSLNAGYKQYVYGNSGTTKVAVSLCLLLSYDSANSYLIDPSARSSGHSYYTLNVREEKARETLEALFVYLGELFGQEDCYVTNWILGNEINSSKAWNYSGSLSFDTYMQCYTTAFRMLYNAVKSEKTGNTVCISLDNGWTAVPDTYAGKTTLDTFAKKINAENPNIEWSIAYHPYSYPLTRADFWNDSSNTTSSNSTKYISMQNITVLTNYAASLEKTYKMNTGSIRVLLTEQGYSFSAGSEKQATAIARGYYIAEFNDRIDAFIIRAIVDDAEEAKGNLYFGLMNSQQDKRIAFYVYEYMDTNLSQLKSTSASSVVSSANYSKFNSAKNILCNTNWSSIVPGFNASKLAGMK